MGSDILERIADGRTDLVFEYLSEGRSGSASDGNGEALITWCAYYGDVSAIRFLLGKGESLEMLGPNLGLDSAAFHGHWQLYSPGKPLDVRPRHGLGRHGGRETSCVDGRRPEIAWSRRRKERQ